MPRTYSQAERDRILDHVCDQLATGRALSRILREDEGLCNPSTLLDWQEKDDDVARKVTRARELGVATLLDETLKIADTHEKGIVRIIKPDGTVEEREEDMLGHRKLRIHARHEYARMIAPRKYGPKLDVTSGGEKLPAPATPVLVDARIQSLVLIAQRRLVEGGTLEGSAEPDIEELMG